MRGGKREGAGRKRALSFSESILLGQLCEDLQCDIPIKHAMQEYKKHPDVRALQDARDRLTGKTSKERARIIRGEIRPKIRAVVRIRVPAPREKTRPQIIRYISEIAKRRFQMAGATPRRVEACWKMYRTFMRENQRLISARVLDGSKA